MYIETIKEVKYEVQVKLKLCEENVVTHWFEDNITYLMKKEEHMQILLDKVRFSNLS